MRAKLLEIDASAIARLPGGVALRAVFTTPALYRNAVTLTHEDESGTVELAALAGRLGLPAVGGDRERAP